MTSGPRHATQASYEWLEEAYARCPIASIVVDRQRAIAFCNDAARRLLGLKQDISPKHLADLQGPEEHHQKADRLDALIVRALDDKTPLRGWKGRIAHCPQRPLEARFIPLPGPDQFLLCQLRPYRAVDDERRVQLITALAEVHRRSGGFEEAGQLLVDAIHHHLETSVVALAHGENGDQWRWQAGSDQLCGQLAQSAPRTPLEKGGSASFYGDGSSSMIRLSLRPTEELEAQLLIAVEAPQKRVRQSAPFWNCLITTAETALRSARLLEANRQRRQRLRAVLEHMPMAVMLFDTNGAILDLNLRARAMSGRRTWERVGVDDHPFEVCDIDGNILPKEQWPLLRAVRTGECCEEKEFVLDFGDVQRTLSLTVIPITDDNDQITSYLTTGRDVTKRSEEERRKDEFLSVASHELRSPLTPLSGFIHLARKQAESGHEVDPDVLRRAGAQVERLQRLIDSLLDMSRLETGKLPIRRVPVELTSLVRRIMSPWQDGPRKDRIDLDVPDQPIDAQVDPDRIDQVLTNVVDNAFKHGRDDGNVRVALRTVGDGEVELSVTDEGDGMPQEMIDRVFERYFYDEETESSGMGIGLYVSRQIVDDHGGSISISSDVGQPTTVTIRLPTHPSQ